MNLIAIPTNTLQIMQMQVREELRGREIKTYKKNEKLSKDNEELHKSIDEMKGKLMMEQYNATLVEQTINDLCVEFPQCKIPSDAILPQKLKIIVERAKYLEETIKKMDVEHKACITKLEARTPRTPPAL